MRCDTTTVYEDIKNHIRAVVVREKKDRKNMLVVREKESLRTGFWLFFFLKGHWCS